MAIFTISLDGGTDQGKLETHVRQAMPLPFRLDRSYEEMGAIVSAMVLAWAQVRDWSAMTFLEFADNIWLDLHARDRSTRRQENEIDDVLRARLKQPSSTVTRESLLDAAQAVVDASGIVGDVAMLEVRRDGAFFSTYAVDSRVNGGTFEVTGSTVRFTPTIPFRFPPFRTIEPVETYDIEFSGSANPGNDGRFLITGLNGAAVEYDNPSAVAGVDNAATWVVYRQDFNEEQKSNFKRAYLGRGYRFQSNRSAFILILPFGCTDSTVASVREAIRLKIAAGVTALIECRQSP